MQIRRDGLEEFRHSELLIILIINPKTQLASMQEPKSISLHQNRLKRTSPQLRRTKHLAPLLGLSRVNKALFVLQVEGTL